MTSSWPNSPGREPAAPVEPPHTAPGAPDPWLEDEIEWLDQVWAYAPWWGNLWDAWQTIEEWISGNLLTPREWQ